MSFGRKVNDCSNKGTDMGRGTRGERRRRLLAAALSGVLLSEPFELVVGADGTIDAEDTSVAQGSGRTPGYYVADDGLTIVAVDEPRPWSPPSIDDPDEPGTPTDPEAPTGPGDPDNSGAGDVSVKPGTSAAGNARPQTPDTGDRTNVALPVAVAFLGAALIAGALLVRRRMRE